MGRHREAVAAALGPPAGSGAAAFRPVPGACPLPPEDLAALTETFPSRALWRGEALYRRGDQAGVAYLVRLGGVRLSAVGHDGRFALLGFAGPGSLFGEEGFLRPPGTRRSDAVAIRGTVVLTIDPDRLEDGLGRSGRPLGNAVLRALAARADIWAGSVANALAGSVAERLRNRLCALAADHGVPRGGGTLIDLPFTQGDLAAMVGASRESVNRALAGFAARGWLVRVGSRYVVTEVMAADGTGW